MKERLAIQDKAWTQALLQNWSKLQRSNLLLVMESTWYEQITTKPGMTPIDQENMAKILSLLHQYRMDSWDNMKCLDQVVYEEHVIKIADVPFDRNCRTPDPDGDTIVRIGEETLFAPQTIQQQEQIMQYHSLRLPTKSEIRRAIRSLPKDNWEWMERWWESYVGGNILGILLNHPTKVYDHPIHAISTQAISGSFHVKGGWIYGFIVRSDVMRNDRGYLAYCINEGASTIHPVQIR